MVMMKILSLYVFHTALSDVPSQRPYRKDAEHSGAVQTQEVHVYEN